MPTGWPEVKPNTKTQNMKLNQWLGAIVAGISLAGHSRAADGTDTNRAADLEALQQQVQALNQKVQALEQQRALELQTNNSAAQEQIRNLEQEVRSIEHQREVDQESAAATAKAQPRFTVGADGVNLVSADTNFALAFHGVLQVDSRSFFANDNVPGDNSFLLRRARPILQGTVYRDFDFIFVPDFGGSQVQIFDAYVNYRYSPELQFQAGKFKSPVGLETLQQDVNILFNERSLATDLVPNRDVGFTLHGDLFNGAASYAVGIFNGAPDYSGTTTNADFDSFKAFAGRVFFQPLKNSDVAPLKGLGFGLGGSYETDHAWTNTAATALTSGYTTDGQQKFFAYTNGVVGHGMHWRLAPQGSYYYGPLGVFGEYVISDQEVRNVPRQLNADLQNTAWDVSGSWLLTGEDATPNGVVPRYPFNPNRGHWGAWQVVGRYAQLDVDNNAFPNFANPNSSASKAQAWSAGLNWYLNRNIRFDVSFSHTWFEGGNGSGATVTKQPENVLFTRIQLGF
jgi:phosphate-selective porin OprO/OprP